MTKALILFYTTILCVAVQSQVDLSPSTDPTDIGNLETDDVPNVDESEPLLTNVVSDVNKTLTSIYNQVTSTNFTLETKNQTLNETKKHVKCKPLSDNVTDEFEAEVAIINGTLLSKLLAPDPEVTSRDMEGSCVLVMFYATICPFSCHAAPHFNALARAYPNIKMVALDALRHHGINAQYGIVGVPTLKMFHNGKPVGKFNGTEYNIHAFSRFVNAITAQQPQKLVVTSKDFQGPVSSVLEKKVDYFLILSWTFILICAAYYFCQSRWYKTIVEAIQNNWRESEAQHEHTD